MLLQVTIYGLVFLAVLFALCGVWLMLSQRRSGRTRLGARMMGVKQVKRFELGGALAETREREERKRTARKEAMRRKAFSEIPAVDQALKSTSWAEKLNGMLIQAQMPISVASFVMLSGMLAAMGAAMALIARRSMDPLLAVLFATILGGSPWLYTFIKVKRRVKKFSAQLPDALDLLSSSVKAGQSLNAAVQNVADEMPDPVGDEFKILSDELTFGVDFNTSMRHLVNRVDSPDVRFLSTALMIQKETGGNLSEVLDGLQKTIRERFRILGQVKTLTAQGKLSGLIVGLLPLVLCAFLYSANPNYMKDLFATDTGRWLLVIAGTLQMTGVLIIARIVNIKV